MARAKVGIVNYGVGNLRSVANAIRHIGGDAVVSSDAAELDTCGHLILPGVGAFPHGINALKERQLDKFLGRYVASDRPCLGICLGMQLLMEHSSEFQLTNGLGLLPGTVESLKSFTQDTNTNIRLPNVGWLPVDPMNASQGLAKRLFEDLTPEDKFYFVHSFAVGPKSTSSAAQSEYSGIQFTSAVGRGQLVGTQFHPEKSGETGLTMLRNFIAE